MKKQRGALKCLEKLVANLHVYPINKVFAWSTSFLNSNHCFPRSARPNQNTKSRIFSVHLHNILVNQEDADYLRGLRGWLCYINVISTAGPILLDKQLRVNYIFFPDNLRVNCMSIRAIIITRTRIMLILSEVSFSEVSIKYNGLAFWLFLFVSSMLFKWYGLKS